MSEKILVPVLGESITEATVSKWLKNEGDSVEADEPIVELETDKVNLEVPAPVSGTLTKINSISSISLDNLCNSGISFRQGLHHEAKKLKIKRLSIEKYEMSYLVSKSIN